jgi:hypothetical protein
LRLAAHFLDKMPAGSIVCAWLSIQKVVWGTEAVAWGGDSWRYMLYYCDIAQQLQCSICAAADCTHAPCCLLLLRIIACACRRTSFCVRWRASVLAAGPRRQQSQRLTTWAGHMQWGAARRAQRRCGCEVLNEDEQKSGCGAFKCHRRKVPQQFGLSCPQHSHLCDILSAAASTVGVAAIAANYRHHLHAGFWLHHV